MHSDFHVSVKAVLTDGPEWLILRTTNSSELPGGRIELGETPTAALSRELYEELPGICDIKIGELVGWHLYDNYEVEGKNLFVLIFKVQAKLPRPIRLSAEHESAEWLSVATAKEVLSEFQICWGSSV